MRFRNEPEDLVVLWERFAIGLLVLASDSELEWADFVFLRLQGVADPGSVLEAEHKRVENDGDGDGDRQHGPGEPKHEQLSGELEPAVQRGGAAERRHVLVLLAVPGAAAGDPDNADVDHGEPEHDVQPAERAVDAAKRRRPECAVEGLEAEVSVNNKMITTMNFVFVVLCLSSAHPYNTHPPEHDHSLCQDPRLNQNYSLHGTASPSLS